MTVKQGDFVTIPGVQLYERAEPEFPWIELDSPRQGIYHATGTGVVNLNGQKMTVGGLIFLGESGSEYLYTAPQELIVLVEEDSIQGKAKKFVDKYRKDQVPNYGVEVEQELPEVVQFDHPEVKLDLPDIDAIIAEQAKTTAAREAAIAKNKPATDTAEEPSEQ